ncbi:MAG: energy-coupling factor ABC transporter ATP-binding protein [Anaerolineaceae bacterium]
MQLTSHSIEKRTQPALQVENLSYIFPDGKKILTDVNFEVQKGDKVAIIGGNGCGKSTLLMLINGLLIPSVGKVIVNGNEVNRANRNEILSTVGLVFQNADDQLFSKSVFDAVAFGLIISGKGKDEIKQRVTNALETVHLTGSEHRNPFKLSGGEKKKIALASAIATQPELLLLDDPTMGLDAGMREELIKLFFEMKSTLLIASQDLEMVGQLAERTLVMAGGYIIAEGPTYEILNNQSLMTEQGLLG